MVQHKYNIKYIIEEGKFTKEELAELGNAGGCDQIGVISVMGGVLNGESLSMLAFSLTGDGEQWDGEQWFEIWSLLTQNILGDPQVPAEKAKIARETFEKIRELKLRGR